MKKIFYVFSILCFMFFGATNVFAAGSVIVQGPTLLEVPVGGTAQFDIYVENAMALATITSANVNVVTVGRDTLFDSATGKFWSDGDLKGKDCIYTFEVTAVGSAGATTSIEIDIYDATAYTGEDLSKKVSIPVKIISASVGNTVTITYDANKGKDAPATQTIVENGKLTSVIPKREGYEFIGWNTKADGSGTSYSAGGVYTGTSNVTLYAQWKAVGNVESNPQTADSTMIIFIAIIVTFGGYAYWYTKKAKEN